MEPWGTALEYSGKEIRWNKIHYMDFDFEQYDGEESYAEKLTDEELKLVTMFNCLGSAERRNEISTVCGTRKTEALECQAIKER